MLPHLILGRTAEGKFYYYPHISDPKTGSEAWKDVPGIIQLLGGELEGKPRRSGSQPSVCAYPCTPALKRLKLRRQSLFLKEHRAKTSARGGAWGNHPNLPKHVNSGRRCRLGHALACEPVQTPDCLRAVVPSISPVKWENETYHIRRCV